MFINFSYPCTVTDVLADGISGVCIDILIDVMIGVDMGMVCDILIVVTSTAAITLVFVVGIPCAADDLVFVIVIDVVFAMDVDMLSDQNPNGLAAVMTLFCCAASSCRPTTILDRLRALQACKPSYHVC